MKLHMTEELGAAINPGMFGLFFEDINYGLDGGLHAEMIENRSFEFIQTTGGNRSYRESYSGLYGWSAYPPGGKEGSLDIQSDYPQNPINPHYLVFTAKEAGQGFANKAYDGIYMRKALSYRISFYARAEQYAGSVEVVAEKNHRVVASVIAAEAISDKWMKYEVNMMSDETLERGTFVIRLNQPGTVCFDFISMIPSDAVLGLFRQDLVQWMREMKPGFLRFPGGCVVEGYSLGNRYQWKHSVGKSEERRPIGNRWALHGNKPENQFTSPYSHYNQTLGVGYYEYFLLCEHLGAKPIPVLSVGLACQFQSSENVPADSPEFQQYIDDALDLIEFANGSQATRWGKLRAEMGHPEPFGLEYIGIGNEQWESEHSDFFRRYERFQEAIHEKNPAIQLIGSAGPDVHSEKYAAAWSYYRAKAKQNPDFVYAVDEHYYVKPEWMYENLHFYDQYPRDIKIFAGEFAVHYSNGMNAPHLNMWGAALAEAAFMTGLERNADIVTLACYAPLFARIGYTQWSPDMIWFDGAVSYGTPSYYVQKLYSTLKGTHVLKTSVEEEAIPFTASYDRNNSTIILKLVNPLPRTVWVKLQSEMPLEQLGELYKMEGKEDAFNSLEKPQLIAPRKSSFLWREGMEYELEPGSFHVMKLFCQTK
ncbi:alpha-L-arabinofuranosidase C-terminal domain-containing protein [Paenibacillus sp. HB172176]|uniref:alpha-L-arabinofuranosidase C-terminal domain-containing protein n=1 Tax=Paenibacillus sp. HB172176 TaxID=2493690 RepID=UPI00143B30F4|nr:alpha-L-arabinofuranosidase C-terminal domain-containing protein [Paenibacillus sp. HB172176]